MAKYYACMLIQRVLIPSFLAACSLFRPVALSFLYLLMLFVLPFVPVATPRTIKGRTGIYFKILILISTLTCLSHGIFEIILVSIGFDKIESCGLTERILRHIGFIQLSNLPALSVLIWVSPEIVMFLSSIGFFFLLKSMAIKKVRSPSNTEVTNNGANTESQENNSEHENIIQDSIEFHSVSDDEEPSYTQERMALLTGVAKVIAFATLLLAAAIRPSVPSAVYFLIYLGLGSWWACYRQLGKGFAVILRIVMVFASIHVIAIMLYQTPWPQEFYPANELLPRLLGFTPLFLSSCENSTVVQTNATTFANITIPDDIRMVTFNSYASIDQVLNPMVILLCFYVTALTSSLLLGPQLMRRSTKKLKATVARIRDGSLEEEDTIPLDEMGEMSHSVDENEGPDCMEQITVFLENATTFIFKNCYIFMNVAMMTWSIMYHSWLTFVLLIWANILWIIPNQRKTMLRSSPFVVIYAELLLLAQFLYCMGIPDDILPSYVDMKGINLEQIGFVKVWYLPCRPLILKSVFTLMFWITLRQLAQERQQERQTSTLADMVAPLQVTMGAAAADMARADKEQKDERFITKLVAFCTNFLNRFWIWIVVITLFLSGIVGKKMTGFRIIYMTLFLVFLLTFQISRKFWKKIMYGFWLTVIIYAMTILVLVYTYQFDRFPDYWEQYLGISKTLQSDIGLEIYKTRDLFLNLFIPTIVVIMTVLQLHYFHSKFISLIEPPRPNGIAAMMQPPPQMLLPPPPDPNHVLQNMEENLEGLKQKGFFKKFTKISGVSLKQILTFISVAKKKIRTFYELSLIFLELHLIKLVIFMGFWLSIKETCVVHISFVVLTVLAALMRTNKQILMSRIVSVAVGVLLLAKMIYQVTYIQHSDYDVDCQNATESALNNTAEWMGFHKIEKGSNLPGLLRFYIMYITLVTVDVIIRMRQKFVRVIRGESEERPLVMFVKITRKEADNNLRNMLKYLANYGFYKFGVEICLICTVIMIGLRMDIIGLFYAFWLSFMFYVNRGKLSVLWPAFQWFIAISLIVQYIVIVGAPPFLCIKYPWEEGLLKNLQIWAMLPDVSLINIANKLIPEFILLMLVTRQTLVFRIEREFSTSQTEYKGGTNSSVIDDIRGDSDTKFVNPTPDFTSTQRNWLDVLKCGFLLGFFWLALAIVFLTGANRVNLFSVGYLIGSFTFLWQGSDFYLRPIEVITRWWIRLIGYNVFVITSKAVLQIPGCLFYKTLEENCCWLIQLLSIVCAQREKAESAIKDKCVVNANQANIVWDVVCFAFLIIQYRVFQSHYFCHIINDTKASTILASRGAELIEDLKKKQMEQEMEHESKMLKKLKMKMDRIKATQKKFLEPVIDQPKTHAQGYHTPIEDDENGSLINEPEIPSEVTGIMHPTPPQRGSILLTQAPSPSSAILTVSLEGYLEPQRLSFSSPPASELIAAMAQGSDESYPVFSPPPLDETRDGARNNSLQPPRVTPRTHRRQSSLNTVSWPDQFEGNARGRIASSNLDPPDETEDGQEEVQLRRHHRRESSMGTSWIQDDTVNQQRRCSDLTWAPDVEPSMSQSQRRPFSWGPVGEMSFRESLISTCSRTPTSHHESIRSGDYYMFEELDDEQELNLFTEKADDDYVEDSTKSKYAKKKKFSEVVAAQLGKKTPESDPGLSTPFRRSTRSRKSDRSVGEVSEDEVQLQKIPGRSTMSEPITHTKDEGDDEDTTITDRGRHIPVIPEEKPSTSKYDGSRKPGKAPDKDHDDDSEEETEEEDSSDSKDNAPERGGIFRILKLIWAFIESFMISIIIRLNKISRHYRYVMRVLAREKIELKKKPDFGSGRRARNMKWIPRVESSETTTEVLQSPSDEQQKGQEKSVSTDEDGEPSTATLSEGDQDQGLAANYAALQQSLMKPRDGDDPERRTSVVPEIRILAPSLERGLDDLPAPSAQPPPPEQQALAPMTSQKVAKGKRKFKVDEIEDFSEKEHSSIVELLMAIWFVILSNTDLVCYFMVFINQINSASLLSLPLPFMVFCWGTLTIPRPSKTFWVTLIAYTQIVVLLKCICQFELLYWNEQPIPPNLPLAPARILGIEKKKSYATYDLALLLILFFHRFMLKSLGLWKSDFKEEPLTQGIYEIKDPSQPSNGQRNEVMEIARLDPDNISGDEDRQLIEVNDIQDEDKKFVPPIMKASLNRHTSSIRRFFSQLLDPSSRVSADVYAYMFFCDFFNFMVVIFGFTAFGSQQGDGGVTAYLEENKVPLAFLIMLILQFALIIIDRALYLRKYMLGKIIFQYGLTLGIHIWMFFVLPAVTERSFNAKNPPVVWYMVKCIYLLLSAYQIRCGYPTRILGNFLTRSFSFLNSMAYKGYMFIPFLFELRTLMDWIWTDTSMTLFDWLKMEDIFANMYQLKCSRNFEEDFPAPRGEKKKSMVKYAMGGGMLFGLIMIIWFPLGLFALGNTVGEANPPYEVSVSMKIGPYEPIYMANAQGANIRKFGEAEWQQLNTPYKRDKTAVTFLSNYEADDVAVIDLGPNSTSIWSISPPDRERLREDLEQNITLKMVFRYTVSRLTYSKENPGVISEQTTFDLEPGDPKREVLSRMLNGSSDSIDIPHLLPKFMKVKNSGSLKPIPQLIPMEYGEMAGDRNITLRLYESLGDRWWELKENCSDEFYIDVLSRIPSSDCKSAIVFYTFNDKLFPPTLSYLTGGGIIGMYTTFIFVISRVIRGIFAGSSFKIMYDDLPYVDRILQLCLDIYLVRESMEFAIEEDLFAKLIFLYRSPETMIKWTRPKEEDATHPSISVTATGGPRRNEDDDENNDDTSIRSSSPPQLRKRQI